MCQICQPILGKTKPHEEKKCPLKQAAYCPLCAVKGHFAESCPNKATQPLSDSLEAIPVKTAERMEEERKMLQPTYCISENTPDGVDVYTEYMKLYEIEMTGRKDKYKHIVKAHIQSRGCIVTHPPSKPTTRPYNSIL